MAVFKKIFNEGLNADADFSSVDPSRLLRKGQWINSSNVRVYTTDSGKTGNMQDIGGTAVVFSSLPDGTNVCIGGCSYDSKKRILFCNYNSGGAHGIYCYDKLAGTTYTVALSSQVEGGLNFSKYNRIDSNAKIIDDLFIFNDANNEPRKINIEAGIKLNQSGYSTSILPYANPLKYTTLTLIKRPPVYPLDLVKFQDEAYTNNNILNRAYLITYRYWYRDNEISALASYGKRIPYNFKDELSNAIGISLPFSEYIDDDIQQIDICVKYLDTNKTFVVKTWSKDTDAAAIANHNSHTTALYFAFYDDVAGDVLDDVTASTSFHIVPLLSETLELAKDRLFHGNCTLGYTSPLVTSLTTTLATIDTGSTGSFTGKWGYVTLHANFCDDPDAQDTYMYPFIQMDVGSGAPHSYYYFPSARSGTIWNGGEGTVPTTMNMADATFAGDSEADLITYLKFSQYPYSSSGLTICFPTWLTPYDIAYAWPGFGSSVTVNEFPPEITTQQFMKSGGSYLVNIAFYDRFRRKCGVVKEGVKITIPERNYSQTVFNSAIQWALSNTNALNEIPVWAYYYQIHVTKNLTEETFMQARAADSKYVTKNQDGTFTYGTTYNYTTTYAIGIDASNLANYGMGYDFNTGDMIKLYLSGGGFYNLRLIGADGNYVHAMPVNFGISLPTDMLFEIYTPALALLTQPYYETGPVYPISNPGLSSRAYTTLVGIINGDAYSLQRAIDGSTNYLVEAMSPNDLMWKFWWTDTGWVNAVDRIGQTARKGAILFSDTYVSGTKDNGLNLCQPLNEVDLDNSNGAIRKLQLANKVQQDGTVLLAICEDETVSCYLGEQELLDTNGNPYVAKSDAVIGTTRPLEGSMGTADPSSVFEYNGLLYWWDRRNDCAVQYASNGLFPVTKNNFVRPARLFSKKYNSMSVSDIETLGGYPFIIGGFDPYNKEVLFSIPPTEATPPMGTLVDYDGVPYPYDIYDGVAKTLIYKHLDSQWIGSMSFTAEMFIRMDDDLYSFKNGGLYIHNQSNSANFYGTQYKASVMFCVNTGMINTYKGLGLECNKEPEWIHLATEDPYLQSSDLPYPGVSDFDIKQGVIQAGIMRDRLSPNVTGTYDQKQLTGDKLFGKALLVTLQFEFVNDPTRLALRAVNMSYSVNQGTILNKQ